MLTGLIFTAQMKANLYVMKPYLKDGLSAPAAAPAGGVNDPELPAWEVLSPIRRA